MIKRLLRRALRRARPVLFDSYEEAVSAAESDYEDARIVRAVAEKTRALRAALSNGKPVTIGSHFTRILELAALVPLTDVLDFGGAFGTHYFMAQRTQAVVQSWRVVETPAMVEASIGFRAFGLSFQTDLKGPTPGLLHTDGTIEHVPDPLATLADLVGVGAQYLAIRRTFLTDSEPFSFLWDARLSDLTPAGFPVSEDGPIKIPTAVLRRSDYERVITQRYRPIFEFTEPPIRIGDLNLTWYGFLYELR